MAASKEQRSFSFPLLKAPDVLQCMDELQIELTAEEMTTTPPEAVRRVFETVIDICMGVTKEELDQPAAVGLAELEHGELHEDSIPQLAYFRAVYVPCPHGVLALSSLICSAAIVSLTGHCNQPRARSTATYRTCAMYAICDSLSSLSGTH